MPPATARPITRTRFIVRDLDGQEILFGFAVDSDDADRLAKGYLAASNVGSVQIIPAGVRAS